MTFNFETSSPPFVRKYQQIDDHTGKVCLGEIEAFVEHDPFWLKFAQGWEPETERIYRKLVSPGSTVLDIGAWIGSTILFALACGAEKIVALEPNPGSHKTIRQFINMNPLLSKRIFLTSRAISDKEETLTMGLAENESDTSTSGIGGNDFEVEATTLSIIRSEYDLTQLDLVKIDIEGAVAELEYDYSRAFAVAVDLGIVNNETLDMILGKAKAHEGTVSRIISGEPEPEVVAEVVPEETQTQETKKEEPKEESAAGLASLFG
jgi:FkbM family methyltransferase